jgi:putative transposase
MVAIMARLARVVAPGVPHHITQRGNRGQQTFFSDEDYEEYIELMAEWGRREGVEIWAYCLMPNHVHLIAVPESPESLRRALGEAHRRYTRGVNFRRGWRGHLWEGRFASFPMDEAHTLQAARYIELNPVEAGLVERAREYRWSSAAAHGLGRDDALVRVKPLLDMVGKGQWGRFLAKPSPAEEWEQLRRHERTGRPLGEDAFVARLESVLNRELRLQKRGPKGPWKHTRKGRARPRRDRRRARPRIR